MKTIRKGEPIDIVSSVDYSQDAIVSKAIFEKKAGSLTLFAFDAGQGLSEHTSPYDAAVHILDGAARLTIGGRNVVAKAGEIVTMPANVPHSLHADSRFKMLLIMIR